MATDMLPTGTSAMHPDWPKARFNLSGMFVHDPLIVQFINVMEQSLACRLPIQSIHGAPAVPWNAGRSSRARFDPSHFASMLQFLHDRGIGYFPTFTNHRLEDADLRDPLCNAILESITRRPDLNGVIITSDLLCSYVAKRYPSLRQIASITKVTLENGAGRIDYYRGLGKRFAGFVVHPDDCRNLSLLEQLDRDKAEIIVNENCVADCTNRTQHYEAFSRFQKALGRAPAGEQRELNEQIDQVGARCQSPVHHIELIAQRRRSCNLSRPELKAIHDMGFHHYKLQGRADDPFLYAYDLTRFMLEPDVVAPLLLKSLAVWLTRVMVRHN